MTAPGAASVFSNLSLPPAYAVHALAAPADAFAQALAIARRDGAEAAGTLVLVERADLLDLAVVLAPDEPLATARRAFLAGMVALADAVGAHGPPEMPLTFVWPDTLVFDGARLGGGRLAAPDGCGEDAVPDWLVFSGMLIVSKAAAGDPGLTPGSTALDEEGFPAGIQAVLVESFARNLIRAFAVWAEDGFTAVADRYLAHLPTPAGLPVRIAETGNVVLGDSGAGERWPLAELLRVPAWHDPATGVRL
jgi:biotin-(acetyl-CoA carboxylase) ligase